MRITRWIWLPLGLFFPSFGFAQFNTLGLATNNIAPTALHIKTQPASEKKDLVSIQRLESPTLDKSKYSPPLRNIYFTSAAGWRKHPVTGQMLLHNGIDLRAYYEPVYAVMDEMVEGVGANDLSGIWVKLLHTKNMKSSYAHLSRLHVTKGEKVSAGDLMGISGNTGRSTEPHLHFSMKN
jgi:murein DD-endopeptidase MepM/ murein hydrolase activator NlpD